jgi:hypothetical protein
MAEKKDEKPKPKTEKSRKKWNRPAIRTGKLFEVNSLACGKLTGTSQCSGGGTMS